MKAILTQPQIRALRRFGDAPVLTLRDLPTHVQKSVEALVHRGFARQVEGICELSETGRDFLARLQDHSGRRIHTAGASVATR